MLAAWPGLSSCRSERSTRH